MYQKTFNECDYKVSDYKLNNLFWVGGGEWVGQIHSPTNKIQHDNLTSV